MRFREQQRRSRWLAAAELGLISSTFSTLVSQLFAARIGRDAAVDWMTVAAIPLRDGALSAEPSWSEEPDTLTFGASGSAVQTENSLRTAAAV